MTDNNTMDMLTGFGILLALALFCRRMVPHILGMGVYLASPCRTIRGQGSPPPPSPTIIV